MKKYYYEKDDLDDFVADWWYYNVNKTEEEEHYKWFGCEESFKRGMKKGMELVLKEFGFILKKSG